MKTIVRIMQDGEKFWVASVAYGEAEHLGPFNSLKESMKCFEEREKKNCKKMKGPDDKREAADDK